MLYDVSYERGLLKYEPSKTPISLKSDTLETVIQTLKILNNSEFFNQETLKSAKELSIKILSDIEQLATVEKIAKIENQFFHPHDQKVQLHLNEMVKLAEEISKKTVLSQVEIIERATQDAKYNPLRFLTIGRNYGILDEDKFIEILSIAIVERPKLVLEFLKELQINNEENRTKIVNIYLKFFSSYTLVNYLEGLFELAKHDQKTLQDIACAVATILTFNKSHLSYMLKFFDEKTKLEFVFKLVKLNPRVLCYCIKDFPLNKEDKEKIIYEILKGHIGTFQAFIENLPDFGKLSNKVKQDIQIEEELRKNPAQLAENIDKYELDPAKRLEIAERIAKSNGRALCRFIQKFGIDNEDTLIRLAELALKKDKVSYFEKPQPSGMEFFPNFGIKNPQKLILLAKSLITSNPETAQYIQFFTNDEKTCYEICKVAVQSGVKGLAQYLHKLIKKSDFLDMAKEAITSNSSTLKEYALLFEDSKDRLALAKSCNLDYLKLDSENEVSKSFFCELKLNREHQIELAHHFLTFDPLSVLKFISDSELDDENLILKCINVAEKQEPGALACFLDAHPFLLGVIEEWGNQLVVKLLKKEANRDPDNLFTKVGNIRDLKIDERYDIMLEKFKSDPTTVVSIFSSLYDNYPIFQIPPKIEFSTNLPPEINNVQTLLHQLKITEFDAIIDQLKALDINEDSKQIKEGLAWIFYTAARLPANYNQNNATIWGTIFKYRQPKMRYNLTDQALLLINQPENLKNYNAVAKTEHLKLPALFLSHHEAFKNILQKIHKEKRAEFKDATLTHLFISTLHLLSQSTLPIEKQAAILEDILKQDKKKMKNELLNLIGILEAGYDQKLQEIEHPSYEKIFQEILISLVPHLQLDPLFAQKFNETFGKNLKVVAALITYAARLQKLSSYDKKVVLDFLGKFIQEVMNGTYKVERYNEEHSPHLKAVFEKVKGLKEAWSKTVEVPLSYNDIELEKEYKNWKLVRTDDFSDLFMCGTVVKGSCQNVNGNILFTKALLAYPMEGKNQLLAIKDSDGNIICRTIFRIMINKATGLPVLYQEVFYTNHVDPRFGIFLEKFAEDQAKELQLPLLKGSGGGNHLESLGGRSPYEYVDAAGGVYQSCKFNFRV